MSAWPGKFVIGLTGNIGTGKSVVRKMAEHLGAYGIDADSLANRAIANGAPGYAEVVEQFGHAVLDQEEQIDRAKLGRLVFGNPQALARLEKIIHPLVRQALDMLVQRSSQTVIVIEAIKLLETGLGEKCDSIWVSYAPQAVQLERLVTQRKMSETTALQRIIAQAPQEEKIAAADVVIQNDGSYENVWDQVLDAWNKLVPENCDVQAVAGEPGIPQNGVIEVRRARPDEAEVIASLINRLESRPRRISYEDVMAAFGARAFFLLRVSGRPLGLAGWRVENLVSCTADIYLDSSLAFNDALRALLSTVERAALDAQCEISLVFLPEKSPASDNILQACGYQPRQIRELRLQAWQEAAERSMPEGTVMLFKQLRQGGWSGWRNPEVQACV